MKKILIVDDDAINLLVLKEMLSIVFTQADIDECSSAQEVLDRNNLDRFDLILSDIDMPKMDGFELYTQLRDMRGIEAPIIAITALAVQGDRDRILLHGFDAYISKPIDMDELEKVITPYLSKSP